MNKSNKQMRIESMVRDNIDVEKMGLTLVKKEYSTSLGRIDILTRNIDNNYVPIEIKVGEAGDSAIGQILGCMDAVGTTEGIIMANTFSNRVKAISTKFGIALVTYTLDVLVNDESVVYSEDGAKKRVTQDNRLTDNESEIVKFIFENGASSINTIAVYTGIKYNTVGRLLAGRPNRNKRGLIDRIDGMEVKNIVYEKYGRMHRYKEYSISRNPHLL